MSHSSSFRERRRRLTGRLLLAAARDPWVLMVAGLVGGGAWAVGVDPLGAAALGATMVGLGATSVTLSGNVELSGPRAQEPQLRPGTEQAELVETLDEYVEDLTKLRGTKQPAAVVDPTIEALEAATDTRTAAVTVAAAIDSLEDALARSEEVNRRWAGSSSSSQIADSVQRMAARRDALRATLSRTVGEIAEVYTKLLEVSTSVSTAGMHDGSVLDIDSINESLDSLRGAVAELESDHRKAAKAAEGDALGELA